MSIQPLTEQRPHATSRNNSSKSNQKSINTKRNLINSVHDTIKNSGTFTSLTKASISTDRGIFSTDEKGKLTIIDNKVSYKFNNNNKSSHSLLLEEIGNFSKDFAGDLHTLLYRKFINFMYYLHNELNKRGSKAKLRMTMDPTYIINQGFDESSIEVNIKINPENLKKKLSPKEMTLLGIKEMDKYIDIIMPLFHFLDTISKKKAQFMIIKEKEKGVFHYEWTFNLNLWQFDKAYTTQNIPSSGDKKYDEQYSNVMKQWSRKIGNVHRNETGNQRDQILYSIDPNDLYLMESENEFTSNRDNLPFDWGQVDLETLLAYDKPKGGK
ncbi:hypothetical protein [Solibacillus sp. NPDC093137]|uniref:hypothetical protein n=1 Tax=Solibacillus sp. NPDC093137 TaxID=3390678 RepID=UPI003D08239D